VAAIELQNLTKSRRETPRACNAAGIPRLSELIAASGNYRHGWESSSLKCGANCAAQRARTSSESARWRTLLVGS
jgi:hypothetical protein